MLPSKQCLLLTIENVNKPPKNIEKSEYFGFTLQFEYLANVSQKRSFFSGLASNDSFTEKNVFDFMTSDCYVMYLSIVFEFTIFTK